MVGAADMLGYQSSNGGGLGDMGLVRTTSTRGHYLQYVATCVGQGGVGGVPTALTSPWGVLVVWAGACPMLSTLSLPVDLRTRGFSQPQVDFTSRAPLVFPLPR